jgi:LacI family transcriptional regulator
MARPFRNVECREAMTARRRLTIREVAEAAGVSTQTVSRVLNDRPDVAPDTLLRVRQIIADTGYAPNMLARGLTQGRSRTLGVVAFGLEYFGPSRVLTGIERQAARMGYSITLNLVHEPATVDVDSLLNGLSARQVDGIIWAVAEVSGNRTWSHTRGPDFPVPVLLVGGMAGQSSLPSIGIDNAAIGRLATEHLLAGAARRIGIITGPLTWWEAQERLRGWRETLESRGLPVDTSLIVEGDWTANSGEQGLDRLLRDAPDIDAVFASNDQMALGVLHGAHRLGRRIPDDLSVVGVDDIAESSHFWPSLTTVHQPLRDAGALAVEQVDALIRVANRPPGTVEDRAVDQITLLEPMLVVRDSSRQPTVR